MKIKSYSEYRKINEGWIFKTPIEKMKSAIKKGIKKDKKFITKIEFQIDDENSILICDFIGKITDVAPTIKKNKVGHLIVEYSINAVRFFIYVEDENLIVITDPDSIKTKITSIKKAMEFIKTKLNSFQIIFDENERDRIENLRKFDREHQD